MLRLKTSLFVLKVSFFFSLIKIIFGTKNTSLNGFEMSLFKKKINLTQKRTLDM